MSIPSLRAERQCARPPADLFARQVYLNGERLPVKGFHDYCELYLGPKDATGVPRVYERVNDR